jgi:hypothetical protein
MNEKEIRVSAFTFFGKGGEDPESARAFLRSKEAQYREALGEQKYQDFLIILEKIVKAVYNPKGEFPPRVDRILTEEEVKKFKLYSSITGFDYVEIRDWPPS